jgi:DNA-binding NarL/FixJ family response regulator
MRPIGWKAVHLQLLERLPVRHHEWRPPADALDRYFGVQQKFAGTPPAAITANRRARIRALLAAGVKKRQIPARIGISRTAVQKHIRAIEAEEKAYG